MCFNVGVFKKWTIYSTYITYIYSCSVKPYWWINSVPLSCFVCHWPVTGEKTNRISGSFKSVILTYLLWRNSFGDNQYLAKGSLFLKCALCLQQSLPFSLSIFKRGFQKFFLWYPLGIRKAFHIPNSLASFVLLSPSLSVQKIQCKA